MYLTNNDLKPLRRIPNMGQISEEELKKAKEQISPWLWIFSITAFAMALLNTRRIGKMYGSWRKARKELAK